MIYIIIPVHNRIASTLRCLASINRQAEIDAEIVVVDDGSKDGTQEELSNSFPGATVLTGDGSLYWTGAVRLGIEHVLPKAVPGDWVILVNNDVVFQSNKTLKYLLDYAISEQRNVLVSPLSTDRYTGQPITSGTIVRSWFFNSTKKIYKNMIDLNLGQKLIEVDFLTARCLVHPVEIFSKVGNYDSYSFPHYGGDDEFTARAKRMGYRLVVNTNEIIRLDTTKYRKNRSGLMKSLAFYLFDKRSSVNLPAMVRCGRRVAPRYARPTYTLFAIAKSVIASIAQSVK